MHLTVIVNSDELDFLRKKIEEKYILENNGIPELQKNSYKGNYKSLHRAILRSLKEKGNNKKCSVSDGLLRKLYYDSIIKFRLSFLNACYFYISDDMYDRETYLMKFKEGLETSTTKPIDRMIQRSNNIMNQLNGKWYYDAHPSTKDLGYGASHYGGIANFQIEESSFGMNLSITGTLGWKYIDDSLIIVPPSDGWKTISGSVTANDKIIYQYQAFDFGKPISGFCSFNIVRNEERMIVELAGEFYRVDAPYVKGSIYMRRDKPFYEQYEKTKEENPSIPFFS